MTRYCILSDDLTGAVEMALLATESGMHALVQLEANTRQLPYEYDLLLINTDTRNLKPDLARHVLEGVNELVLNSDFQLIYKKIDSTLRGNIGGEIEEVLRMTGMDAAVVAPALPQTGRKTLKGCQYIYSTPLHKCSIAGDLLSSVESSYIPDIVNMQTGLATGVLEIETVRRGKDALLIEMDRLLKSGDRIIVADAETEADLSVMASVIKNSSYKLLPCGSAGLFKHIAVNPGMHQGRHGRAKAGKPGFPALVVSASPAEMTKAQISRALDSGIEVIDCHKEYRDPVLKSEEITYRLQKMLGEGRSVVLDAAGNSRAIENPGVSPKELKDYSRSILKLVARVVRSIIYSGTELAGIMLTGGDTALSVCRELGIFYLTVAETVEPLVPVCEGRISGRKDMLSIVTKAGGFGNEETINNVIKYLEGV